jgi:hypothetical protein
MQPYRADRVVRVLTAIVSVAYFTVWFAAVVVLVWLPAARALARGGGNWTVGLPAPVALRDAETTVQTSWGAARLVVEEARGELELPIEMIPWGSFALLWVALVVGLGLMLLSLYHLRRIFQRVREGAPFDAQNALRMRTLGLLVLTLAVYEGVIDLVSAFVVQRGVAAGEMTVPAGVHIDALSVFMALALVALAEVFRRGAELEDEQSLVV